MMILENIDPNDIQDLEGARQAIMLLLNLVEELMAENGALREENQRLRDEIHRLKGEQGKPDIKANKPKSSPSRATNYSSEQERQRPKKWSKRKKKETIHIDREQVVQVDPAILPDDAQFKGYEDVVVQDVIFRTDNVCFHKEKYYSPSEHKSYLAALPPGYEGQFGPGIKSMVIVQYYAVQASEPKILSCCAVWGCRYRMVSCPTG
jgi:regulator of replication initiation timing